uniref:cGMP-dependent protein kinase interacting domain-containing protein n=1 Tax=Denticeps clupeoides TaxID=299321 RepID=A0AAY4CAW4_9TELE
NASEANARGLCPTLTGNSAINGIRLDLSCPINRSGVAGNLLECECSQGSSACSRAVSVQRWRRGLADQPTVSRLSCPQSRDVRKASKHERASRSNSSGDGTADRVLSQTSYYTRRERRLASLNKEETDGGTKDYKKLYEDALTENEKLKSRLDDNKQEMSKIRSQLEKVVQKHDRISERMGVSETEKKEKQALEKRVSEMEEELKVLTELKSDNQRLKDENGALIRVISKLSK